MEGSAPAASFRYPNHSITWGQSQERSPIPQSSFRPLRVSTRQTKRAWIPLSRTTSLGWKNLQAHYELASPENFFLTTSTLRSSQQLHMHFQVSRRWGL